MPILTQVTGKLERRFRWTRLRYEYGRWKYYTIAENGFGTKIWEWVNLTSTSN